MPVKLDAIRQLLSELPWAELRQAYAALVSAGSHPREAASQVAALVDELVDLTEVVPGPIGVALEAMDRPLIRAAVGLALRYSRRGA